MVAKYGPLFLLQKSIKKNRIEWVSVILVALGGGSQLDRQLPMIAGPQSISRRALRTLLHAHPVTIQGIQYREYEQKQACNQGLLPVAMMPGQGVTCPHAARALGFRVCPHAARALLPEPHLGQRLASTVGCSTGGRRGAARSEARQSAQKGRGPLGAAAPAPKSASGLVLPQRLHLRTRVCLATCTGPDAPAAAAGASSAGGAAAGEAQAGRTADDAAAAGGHAGCPATATAAAAGHPGLAGCSSGAPRFASARPPTPSEAPADGTAPRPAGPA
jgi:hypothetical protein